MDETPSSTAAGELVTHKHFGFGTPKMTTSNGAGFPVTIVTPSLLDVHLQSSLTLLQVAKVSGSYFDFYFVQDRSPEDT